MHEQHTNTLNHDVEAIIKLAQEHDLDALTLVAGEFELSLTRREPQILNSAAAPPVSVAPNPAPPAISTPTTLEPMAAPSGNIVSAPIIGVFYRAAAPTVPPFVQIGDRVTIGQTLCILEAMKLMNEITSDYNGIVTAIHVENAELVTVKQPLFTISPNA